MLSNEKKYFSFKNRRFKGQTQKWFLAEFLGNNEDINLNVHSQIEFSEWTWSSYWHPITGGIEFKRDAYRKALNDLFPYYLDYLNKG